MTRRLPLIAALAGLAVIAAVVGALLAQKRIPVLGGNNEFTSQAAVTLAPGDDACQPGEVIPGGAGAVRVRASASGAPAMLRVRVRMDGRAPAAGSSRWDGTEADVDVPLAGMPRAEVAGARVCLANGGPGAIQLRGYGREQDLSAELDGEPVGARIRLAYVGAEAETRLASAGGTVRRMAAAAPLDLAPFAAIVAVLGVLGLVVAAVKRELTP